MKIQYLILLIFILFSCSEKEKLPAGILKPKKMQAVMWDFVKADVYSEEFIKREHPGTDTMSNIKMQLVIFNKHNVTKETFYKSYHYYYDHPDLMNALLDSITASQNKIKVFQKD